MASDWSNLTLHLTDTLTGALDNFLESWRRNITQNGSDLDADLAEEDFRDAVWYLVVMFVMFASIIVAILVSTVKSRRKEHSNDPYHKYIEGNWRDQLQDQAYGQGFTISNPSTRAFDGPC